MLQRWAETIQSTITTTITIIIIIIPELMQKQKAQICKYQNFYWTGEFFLEN